MKRILLTAIILAVGIATSYATHNRAGEFKIEQMGELRIRATVITYTKTSSGQADRDSLLVFWGDGTSEFVQRSNGSGIPLENDVKFNTYEAFHTYPGRATYTLSMRDKNRVNMIENIPNSLSLPFYVEATYTFLNPIFQGENNSACLLQPPIDIACVNQVYIHNPNAYDPDGDSLAFELAIPQADSGLLVPLYSFPNQIGAGPENIISLDAETGDFVWNTPKITGEYNIAIRIKEYRNGFLINSFIRDMQILVLNCQDNEPPRIDVVDEICIVAGDQLVLDIGASDPNVGQLVKLTALGGPFVVNNAAILMADTSHVAQPFTAQLVWNTTCEHISDEYYSIVLRAVDNYLADTAGLATLRTVRVKVVGPAPENVVTTSDEVSINVSWDMPYRCDMVADDYFKGFSVWRKLGSNQFDIDTCTTGLENRGYEQLISDHIAFTNGRYFYEDMSVEMGKTYCYRILAEFAQTANSGLLFNRVASLPSDEACLQLNRDAPLLTKASVIQTDNSTGQILVRWSKPLASQLDTNILGGPYEFRVLHSPGIGTNNFNQIPGAIFTSPTFGSLTDTMITHTDIDTRSQGHTYKIDFYSSASSTQPFSESIPGSSVFLNVQGTHLKNILTWDYDSPWDNYEFRVFRKDDLGTFELIATVADPLFEDTGLTNGDEYCYRIEAIGTYGFDDIEDPLFNFSQETCGIPMDDLAPCPPVIDVKNVCDQPDAIVTGDAILNTVTWNYPPSGCSNFQDIASFNIYYASTVDADFELIGTINGNTGILEFEHQPERGISGCYAVTSIDEIGNESTFSNSVCVENCPFYDLPNAFTPNGDNANDVFGPFPYRFIASIDLKVFNRWGSLVFQTRDPDINWDGRNLSGKALPDGVYHYVCQVFEDVPGEQPAPTLLKGYIELIAGNNR